MKVRFWRTLTTRMMSILTGILRHQPSRTAQKPADGGQTSNSLSVVDSLVSDVNSDEKTGPAIPGKIAKALDSILANGLNEQVLSKRKEGINRQKNCTMLTTVRVNPEIWDIAKKQTRSMDARLQAL